MNGNIKKKDFYLRFDFDGQFLLLFIDLWAKNHLAIYIKLKYVGIYVEYYV